MNEVPVNVAQKAVAMILGVEPDRVSPRVKRALSEALLSLPLDERVAFELHHGLQRYEDARCMTFAEIAQGYGLTRQRMQQLHKRALSKLRHHSRSTALRAYVA